MIGTDYNVRCYFLNLANANSSISFAAITQHIPDKGTQMVRYYPRNVK
jgi:hypothetical protein